MKKKIIYLLLPLTLCTSFASPLSNDNGTILSNSENIINATRETRVRVLDLVTTAKKWEKIGFSKDGETLPPNIHIFNSNKNDYLLALNKKYKIVNRSLKNTRIIMDNAIDNLTLLEDQYCYAFDHINQQKCDRLRPMIVDFISLSQETTLLKITISRINNHIINNFLYITDSLYLSRNKPAEHLTVAINFLMSDMSDLDELSDKFTNILSSDFNF